MSSPTFYYRHSTKQALTLAATPFAGGGEGELFHVTHPKGNSWVAKIYHPYKRSANRAAKMDYLQQHNPYEADEKAAWVLDTLKDAAGNFVGILMPFQRGSKLEILCSSKLPRGAGDAWKIYERGQPFAMKGRLQLGLQLAAAVAQLHASQHYVLVDLKPDNVLVQNYRKLSLVDLDSVAVVDQGTLRFGSTVATPEYAPPEHYQKNQVLYPSWDNFSLAVILYKLLCGVHPYAATSGAPYEQATSLGQKIEEGLFAHSTSKATFLTVIPPPHQHFFQLPQALQALFLQCFEVGHSQPEKRPTASVWCWAILAELNDDLLTREFRDTLVDGWEVPRSNLPLASKLLEQHRNQKEAWALITPPTEVALWSLSKKVDHTLAQRERFEATDWWKLEVAIAGLAGIFLLFTLMVVKTYTGGVMAWVLILCAIIIRVIALYFRQRQQENKLDEQLTVYQQGKEKIAVEEQVLVEQWQRWKVKEIQRVQVLLEEVDATIAAKDKQVQTLLTARQAAYETVTHRYRQALKTLQLPEEWQTRSWSTIQMTLKRQQQRQEIAISEAMGGPEAQAAYREALEKIEQQLQQLEQQLLDEARVLFDWDAFFDTEETGIALHEKALQNALEAQQVPHLLAIEKLEWTTTDDLNVQTENGSFILKKETYQQLEIFYEAYYFYQEPLAFARAQQIATAPAFLKIRFERLQAKYQTQLRTLQENHQARQQEFQLPYQQALVLTKWQLEELEEFIELRQTALLEVEQDYKEQYRLLKQEIEQDLQQRSAILTQFQTDSTAYWEQLQEKTSYIEVRQLLETQATSIKRLL